MIASLFTLALRLAMIAVATFLFVVLFEHGPANFPEHAREDFQALSTFLEGSSPQKNLPRAGLEEPAAAR